MKLAQVMPGFFSYIIGYRNGPVVGKKRFGFSGLSFPDALVYFSFGYGGVKHVTPEFAQVYNFLRISVMPRAVSG
ncbi:MAG: hypothetical protein Q7R35_14640 [Elusimicrobiota bacterium]|nr:hypothetical protein [Elusimicrobiota bacterium]